MSMRQLKISKQITNRETQSLDKYLQEIGKVDLISSDEEVNLAQRIRQGDPIALEKLTRFKGNLTIRDCSARLCIIDWRIHHTA